MKKRQIVFKKGSLNEDYKKSYESEYPKTTTLFHPLSYYIDGGIDTDRVTETKGQMEYDTVDELGSASSNAWCDPRCDSMDIAESLADGRVITDGSIPSSTQTEVTKVEK